MPGRPRPLLAVRLIGPTASVAAHAAVVAAQLRAFYGDRATCRISNHAARYTGESRAYITITEREEPK